MFAVTRTAAKFANSRVQLSGVYRSLSSEAPKAPAKSGGGLLQRISSFFVGAGVTALVTQFYIFKEIKEGNEVMIRNQKELEKRIDKLEG